jgi:hypothetical protein
LVELERRREELMGNVAKAVSLKGREASARADAPREATQAETFEPST